MSILSHFYSQVHFLYVVVVVIIVWVYVLLLEDNFDLKFLPHFPTNSLPKSLLAYIITNLLCVSQVYVRFLSKNLLTLSFLFFFLEYNLHFFVKVVLH